VLTPTCCKSSCRQLRDVRGQRWIDWILSDDSGRH
jgi:hypothetical protein